MPKRTFTIAVLGVLIAALFALIVFMPSFGWKFRNWITPAGQPLSEDQNLMAQNQMLEAQLATLQKIQNQLPDKPLSDVRAMVYSRYPLNFKNEILVDAGANEGVATGSPVIFQSILVGQVESVFANTALVRTVFDDTFKVPVRIGSKGYDGLLEGGSEPSVGSIAKNAVIMPGDIVYSAGPGLPYGAPIGEIAATSTTPDNLFIQATLSFAYDVNDIQTVLIIK